MDHSIIRDTREQNGWKFSDMISQKLDTGDYTLQGFEDILCIERKASVSELANNISDPRFWREMERMRSYPYKFIICEFSFEDIQGFPHNTDLPKSVKARIRVRPAYVRKKILELQLDYGINVMLCGNSTTAMNYCKDVFKKVVSIETEE